MIALPIIPNTHTGLMAEFICDSDEPPAIHRASLPVIAWDSTGCALVPGNRIGPSAASNGHGGLVCVHRYVELLRDGYDDTWRFTELIGPS